MFYVLKHLLQIMVILIYKYMYMALAYVLKIIIQNMPFV